MQKERRIDMNEKRPRKKKAMLIVLSSIAALLLCIGTAGYVWYRNCPFPTALKMATAIRDGDMDAMLDCIEPGTAQKIELIVGLTGMSADDLFSHLISEKSAEESGFGNTEDLSMKISGYEQKGDEASISVTVTKGDEVTSWEIGFVRISGTWYLSLV